MSYERQVAGGGRVTHVDLGAGAEDLEMDAAGHRFVALLDYMGVVGWAETDLLPHDEGQAEERTVVITTTAVETAEDGTLAARRIILKGEDADLLIESLPVYAPVLEQ